MRMWMVDPCLLCKKHLLGEHVEIHMLVGSLLRGRSIKGFLDRGLLEPASLYSRHAALVREMQRRGYQHKSKLLDVDVRLYRRNHVDHEKSLCDLSMRCMECRGRIAKIGG